MEEEPSFKVSSGDKAIRVLTSLAPEKLICVSKSRMYLRWVKNRPVGVEIASNKAKEIMECNQVFDGELHRKSMWK